MKRDKIFRTCVTTAIISTLILSAGAFADTVILQSGHIVEGTVTDKTEAYLAIIPANGNGMKTYYLAERVSQVNGKDFRRFRLSKNALLAQKFHREKGQKNPVVSLTLKDGRTVKGELVDRNDQYFRLIIDGTDRPEEFLLEDIVKAE